MEKDKKNYQPTISSDKDNKSGSRKYTFYRKPSIKKKVPEVKQTLTSYKRMLKANPLLKYELEGKDLALLTKQSQSSVNGENKGESASGKNLRTEKLVPNFNTEKQKSHSVKHVTKSLQPMKQIATSIIAANKQLVNKNKNSTNISKHLDFNTATPKFLCSTRLENNCSKIQTTKGTGTNCNKTEKSKSNMLNKDSNGVGSGVSGCRDNLKKYKPVRRSLSAQHFDRKKACKLHFIL